MILCADKIFVGNKTDVIEQGAVLVRDGRIAAVGLEKDLIAAHGSEELTRYPGASIIPGMIDLHVHIGYPFNKSYANDVTGESKRALFAAHRLTQTLSKGVTTVRDVGSADALALAVKEVVADGFLQAPRICTAMKALCMTGGHGYDAMKGGVYEVDGVDEVVKAVRTNLKHGADWIKILTSEGYRGEEFNQTELNAIVAEAKRFGMKVSAHAGYGNSIQMCIDAGADTIEHGTHLTLEQARTMAQNGQSWVPTVMVFNFSYDTLCKHNGGNLPVFLLRQKQYLEQCVHAYQDNLRALYDTGVRVGIGTDTDCTGYESASPVAQEGEYLARCGLQPMEILECATKNGAEILGMGDELGQVRENYIADLVVLDGDPSVSPSHLDNVKAVYQSGELFRLKV